jgi:Zn-dependent protease with chaperone function
MAIDSFVRAAALAFLCLLPAAGRWWSGRSLLALLDDPVLPERLLAHRRRNLAVLWAVIVCTLLLGRVSDLFWSLPLIVVTRVAAGYPLRRALFDEHWSLVAYVMTMLRLLLAVGGLWLLLACTPLLASAAGSYDWLVALALGAVLLLWNDRSAEVFRWFVRSEPFRDEALLVRFQAMAAASGAPQPRFELVDLGGGAIANAVALASLRGSSILYTDTLLRLLDSDEAAAITAHEIAHLEHFDTMRLRRLNRTMSALILAAMCAALLPRLVPGMSLLMLAALWCGAVVVTLGWMARDRQRNETASDLRAVELSGQPDALVQALTKLYTFSRVPRRWDTQMERMASHPSLARRIRSIREAAGAPQVPALLQPETVRSRDGRTLITFDCERLHWQESEGVTHVLPYALLTELRVHARPAGGTRLMALERGGRRWEVALEAAEAARAQALLDQVDVRLAEPVVHSQSVHVLQVAGAIVAVCAMWAGHILVAFVALGASVRSAAAFSAAAGGAALGAAGIVGRQAIATGAGDGGWPALPLAVFGVALLVGAWRQREEDATRVVDLGVAGLALLTLLCLTLIATRGGNAVQLYQASLAIPSGAILPLALAAALACRRRRAWQLAAIPVGTVGLMVGIAGSGTFLHAFGHDPFLVAGQLLPVEALTQSPVDEFTLPMAVSDLRLSPGGRQVAVLTRDVAVGVVATFSVGAPGTQFTRFPANDLLFLDDERMLTVAPDGADTVLREVTLQPRAVVWERRIDDLQHGRLAYRRDSGRWLLTGPSFDGRIVVVEGRSEPPTCNAGSGTRRVGLGGPTSGRSTATPSSSHKRSSILIRSPVEPGAGR